MRVAVLHNAVSEGPSADERDVLVQAEVVGETLRLLGHVVLRLPCSLDLASLKQQLAEVRPDVVFNLVESLDGSDRLMPLVPALLDALGIPYTGAPTEAIVLSGSKLLAKERLRAAGLPTPDWISLESLADLAPPYIFKAVWEHASFGLDDTAIVYEGDPPSVQEHLREQAARWGRPCFAEHYVEGREFNLSLLSCADGPEVLPPAEIDFSAFPVGKPHLVGYRAKWDADSFEFWHTPRRFDFPATDHDLLDRLVGLARQCWRLFGLRGWARVDFRIEQDRPWVLEVNANPCLSPDAGFAAALERAGIPFSRAIERILEDVPARQLSPGVYSSCAEKVG